MTVQPIEDPDMPPALADLPGPVAPDSDAVADLARWVSAAAYAERIAQVLARSPFVPKAMQQPGAATAAILAGAELGMSPGMALRAFHVVEGRATLSAEAQRALVLSAGHELEITERGTQRCTIRGRRKGAADWTSVTYTIEDARTAGLTGKAVWKQHPKSMLVARATTGLISAVFADVTSGIPCAEVVRDGDYAGPVARDVRVTAVADDDLLAAAPGHTPTEVPVARAVLPATAAQRQAVLDALAGRGLDRAAAWGEVQRIVGRKLESAADLTADDAQAVIDALAAGEEPPGWDDATDATGGAA